MIRLRQAFVVAFLTAPSSLFAGDLKKLDFVHDIAPIIKARCAECHTNGKYKAGVSFDTREDLLKSKAKSELVRRITSDDPEVRMPQGSFADRISGVHQTTALERIRDGKEP